MDFEKNIKQIEKKIGYVFKDKSLLRQAFTRTSYCNEGGRRNLGYQSNEVLEFFGDGILSASIITIFLRKFSTRYTHGIKTNLAEGDFTVIRSKLSDKKNLSSAVSKIGLEEFLLMGAGDARLGVNTEPSVMEDLFESIIGAVYIDSGMDMEKTISELRLKAPNCKVMVGGAVLNQEYASMIGADYYAKDAMQSVYCAQKVFAGE